MKQKLIFLLIPILIISSTLCKASNLNKFKNSIIIQFDDISLSGVKALKITVYSDNIFHISASPVDSFSLIESLIVEKNQIQLIYL